MSKSNIFETELLKHIFQNANISLLGDSLGVLGSSTPGNLYISLHTTDPGEGGDQTTGEVQTSGYGQYIRMPLVRSASGWTVTNNLVENTLAVNFPSMSSGTGATVSYFGIGTSPTGAGKLLYSGAIQTPLAIAIGITPSFAIGDINITED